MSDQTMSDQTEPAREPADAARTPDDGGERPSDRPGRRRHDEPDPLAAPDRPIGDFGDLDQADRGGDSDPAP